jgi:aryl-alcohol dehydrogenase-like predicted oxidoreductase
VKRTGSGLHVPDRTAPTLAGHQQNGVHAASRSLAPPFSQQDLAKVTECLRAIAPIEAQRGMSVVTRIELAAAFLISAEPKMPGIGLDLGVGLVMR